MDIHYLLISWYLKNHRPLPWRQTKDPYLIWLSEIILQQTKVDQGLPYYYRFAEAFPTVKHLANATEDEVLKMWQGLGYYSRARNLHATAKMVSNTLGGIFPDTYDALLRLKGVGPYTAAAIASFSGNHAHAVVDGNAIRVLARLFDVDIPVNTAPGRKTIEALADKCLSAKDPGIHNQAIMELGALVCTPANPACMQCPLSAKCIALRNKSVLLRPVKKAKKKPTQRTMHYIVIESDGHVLFKKRIEGDIWQGLHDFPEADSANETDPMAMARMAETKLAPLKMAFIPSAPHKSYIHLLTHRRIEAHFWKFESADEVPDNSIYLKVAKGDIDKLPVPRLIHKYLIDSGLI